MKFLVSNSKFKYQNSKLFWLDNLNQFGALGKEKNMFKKVVIPAEAGIQISLSWSWIPVFTGMKEGKWTVKELRFKELKCYDNLNFDHLCLFRVFICAQISLTQNCLPSYT